MKGIKPKFRNIGFDSNTEKPFKKSTHEVISSNMIPIKIRNIPIIIITFVPS